MDRKEIVNSQDYKATEAALEWWYSLPEEQRKATDIDAEPDIVDAYADGVIYGWNNPNWISVEERLPEKEKDNPSLSVNVIVTDGCSRFESYYNFKFRTWVGAHIYGTITHWMQLPQPPRKEE